MNLFVLDIDPIKAATQNCDKHVCKIILEATDCLVTAHWLNGMPHNAPDILITPRRAITKSGKIKTTVPYYPESHVNNHVTKWVRAAIENYRWTAQHGLALCKEYHSRYGKTHKTETIIKWLVSNEPNLPTGSTPFRQAVAREPIDCVRDDVVLAYKLYYVYYKSGFARWRNGTPNWYIRMLRGINNGLPIDRIEQLI